MADFSKPDSLSLYSAVWSLLHSVITSTVTMFDGTSDTNIPNKAKRYNTSNDKFEVYDSSGGGSWSALPFHTPIDGHISNAYLHHGVPVGGIVMYAADGASPPDGFLYCRGQAVSRTTYSALFSIIGTTYGAGNGSTTFNLPNLQQRFPLGKAANGTGATIAGTGGAIDHTHSAPAHAHSIPAHSHGMGHTHDMPSHVHTVSAHEHTVPGHGHSTRNAYSTIYCDGGAHGHTTTSKNTTGNTGQWPAAGAGGDYDRLIPISTSGDHVHPNSNFNGTVGAWNGGAGGQSGDSSFSTVGGAAFLTGSPPGTAEGGATINVISRTSTDNNTTALSTNTDGATTTGAQNPPYLVVNYLIRY